MILHFSQRGFTDGLTFTIIPPGNVQKLLRSPHDPTLCQIVDRYLYRHPVTGYDFYEIHPELPGNVSEDDMLIGKLDPECGIGQ